MDNNDTKMISLTFPQKLYDLTTMKAKSLGLSFEEYVKKVIEKSVKETPKKKTLSNRKYFLAKDEDEMRMQGF